MPTFFTDLKKLFTALEKLFFETPHHKKSATSAHPPPRPPAFEQTIEQEATMVYIMGRLAGGALQERISRTVLP
jgi:hypothetical protein